MIWVEILSRHRDIVARFRINGPEVRIGRGYDNDVIVDDPYVARQHLYIFRDETGQLLARDMDSANGTFLDNGRGRQANIVVDGKHLIRIGQTFLRIRETSHAVERERLTRPQWQPIALTVTLGASILGITGLDVWFTQISEVRTSNYLTPMLVIAAFIIAWVGIWTLLSRIFSGRSGFVSNLLIAQAGLFAFALYSELARFSAFTWNWPVADTYEYVAAWSFLAAVSFLHLRGIGPTRLLFKGAFVMTLLATAIAVQTLQRSEAFSDSGRRNTAHRLMPPALRMVPLRDESAFFEEIANLKPKLDDDRSESRAHDAARFRDH